MISIEKCKEILGGNIPDSEIERLRGSLYTMAESILDNYFEEFARIDTCQNQLSIAEFPLQNRAQRDMGSIPKSTAVSSMLSGKAIKL